MSTRSPSTSPAIAVCAGSDCAADERKRFRRLRRALDGLDVVETKCLGVCHGPVAVLAPVSATPVVIERIKSKHAAEVAEHARQGTTPTATSVLRIVEKDKPRAKAIAKARKAAA